MELNIVSSFFGERIVEMVPCVWKIDMVLTLYSTKSLNSCLCV